MRERARESGRVSAAVLKRCRHTGHEYWYKTILAERERERDSWAVYAEGECVCVVGQIVSYDVVKQLLSKRESRESSQPSLAQLHQQTSTYGRVCPCNCHNLFPPLPSHPTSTSTPPPPFTPHLSAFENAKIL